MVEKSDPIKSAFYKRRAIWIEKIPLATDMTPFARVLGIWLAHRASHTNPRSSYKISTMATIFHVDVRTIMRALKELQGYRKTKAGKWKKAAQPWIIVRNDKARGRRSSHNAYELIFWWD